MPLFGSFVVKKGSKTRSLSVSGTPGPLSATITLRMRLGSPTVLSHARSRALCSRTMLSARGSSARRAPLPKMSGRERTA